MRSFTKLLEVNPGFRPQRVLGFSVNLPAISYPQPSQVTAFWERLRANIDKIPGVEAAGLGDLPLAVRESRALYAEDSSGARSNSGEVRQSWVHGDYFSALGVPLLQGRWFTDQDGKTSRRVLVINETLAKTFFPLRNPIGQRVKWGLSAESPNPWMTVIGVVGDFKQRSLQEQTPPMTFTPVMQERDEAISAVRAMHVAIRASADPAAVVPALRRSVA